MKWHWRKTDGGETSGVYFYGFEWKALFTIGFLYFSPGGREAFHSHAFNAWTWWLRGWVWEYLLPALYPNFWEPSWRPKKTPRSCIHHVEAGPQGAWAFTVRGPWKPTWVECRNGEFVRLTHGRKEVPWS